MIDGIDMLDTADTITVVALFVIFSLWLSIEAMKMIREKYIEIYNERSKDDNAILGNHDDWLSTELRLALKLHTNNSTVMKHCVATYLTVQDTIDDIEFVANIQGGEFVTSSRSMVKINTKKGNNTIKSLLYIIDKSGVSYITVASFDFGFLGEENHVEQYEISCLLEDIFVVEKDRLSKLYRANPENLLFINQNKENRDYHSDTIISTLNVSDKYAHFTITDMDKPSEFITHKFKIELKDIYSI